MRAFLLDRAAAAPPGGGPLRAAERPVPEPGPGEVLVRVAACGVCHTEWDEIEGRVPPPRLPVVPGHQAVGRVERLGAGALGVAEGDRVGVAWIRSACGDCPACRRGEENLCPDFRATGRDADGGYAEYLSAPAAFVHPLPDAIDDLHAAPLLCAGAIGYRSLRLAGLEDGQPLGLTGFGASAHLVLRLARRRYPGSEVYVFARRREERRHALELGAAWAGATDDAPPRPPRAIIDTTPAWRPVTAALRALAPGGRLVVNAIRKEDADRDELARIDYARDLWMEKEIKSVANVTRGDVRAFVAEAARTGLRPDVAVYPFAEANRALLDLRAGRRRGATVLRMD